MSFGRSLDFKYPKLLCQKKRDRQYQDQACLDDFVRIAQIVDHPDQHQEVEYVADCIYDDVSNERRPLRATMGESPVTIKEERDQDTTGVGD